MTRHCMRPGCDRTAAARLTYDTEVAAVWLDRPDPDSEPAQQVCSVHAATLTAPLGWTVTDRRMMAVGPSNDEAPRPSSDGVDTGAGELGATLEPLGRDDSAGGVVEHLEPVASEDEGRLPLSGLDAPSDEPLGGRSEVPAAQLDDPTRDHSPASEPKESGTGGSSGRSGSKGRQKLLDRAFEWTGPQHSVLTTDRVVHPPRPNGGPINPDDHT
ncbi:MAG: DUF3499 family protein [Microthrixaceae bacterium]